MIVEFLSHHEVLQVLVVRLDFHQASGSLQEVFLLFKRINDSEHLFVMDLVVLFYRRQKFAVESHQVLLLFFGQLLREDSSRGKV